MTLTEIANKISTHLKRMERDPKINTYIPGTRLHRLHWANAYRGGKYVMVCYISFQHASTLTREEAERYLAWLDAGNYITHYDMPKEWTPEKHNEEN